jgi:hypothetical protein
MTVGPPSSYGTNRSNRSDLPPEARNLSGAAFTRFGCNPNTATPASSNRLTNIPMQALDRDDLDLEAPTRCTARATDRIDLLDNTLDGLLETPGLPDLLLAKASRAAASGSSSAPRICLSGRCLATSRSRSGSSQRCWTQ